MNGYNLNPVYDSDSPTGVYIPVDVDDCIRELNRILPAALIEKVRKSEEHDLAKHQFGLGMWMRNCWGLWLEESRLRHYFIELGIPEADDMSGIILACYWDSLNGKPIDVPRQIVYNKINRNQIQGGPNRNN